MNTRRTPLLAAIAALTLGAAAPATAADAETRRLEELRNTVVNLLQALVDRGVISREQAQAMVQDAQQKAAATAETEAARTAAESDAVRVTYVPEIVREQIREQVAAELAPEVAERVIETAREQEWGVPGALPDWVRRMTLSGDVRVRAEADFFGSDNAENAYLDFMKVNAAGGIGRAAEQAFINTTEDRQALRARVRFGVGIDLTDGWSAGIRVATGRLEIPVTTTQTLGNYGARMEIGLDRAFLRWQGGLASGRHAMDFTAGRFENPWVRTDLVWDDDLSFDGLVGRYGFSLDSGQNPSSLFLTAGVFPLEEVELSSDDKWFYGVQAGLNWGIAERSSLSLAAAWYDYRNTVGVRNALDSTALDFTAPAFLQRGNTLFDIRNDADPSTNLFALAAEYSLVSVTLRANWAIGAYSFGLDGDYVKNVGYDEADVLARTGLELPARDTGYLAEVNFGTFDKDRPGAWRAFLGYRYLERDAVLDAFTDSDFRRGGTDVKGYYIGGNYSFSRWLSTRLRYLSGTEIDGPPFGLDIIQLELLGRF